MNDQSGTAQLRFLEETAIRLRQNGFTVEPIEDHHLPVCWEKGRLCRIYRFDNSAYTLQQQALCKAYLGDFSGAFSDIDKALNKSRSNFSIRNSHAIILFEANKGKRTPIAEEGMAKAMSMLQECFHSDKRKVYHAQKFADFALYLAKEWGKKDYLEDAQTWLEQIVTSGESQSVRTKNLLDHVRSQIARE